jgi:hypothetical protein
MINYELVGLASFCTLGTIQMLKNFFKGSNGKVFAILSPFLCFIYGACFLFIPLWAIAGIVTIAASQLGYETIIQPILTKLGSTKQDTENGK